MSDAAPALRLGRALPIVLLLFGATDIGLRLIPPRVLAFRAHEALSRFPAPGGPLEANARYSSTRTHGDMDNFLGIGWLRPHAIRYRREVFTTDRYGFRNLDSVTAGGRVSIIGVGSSFTASMGVSDWETFPMQIGALLNTPVYNAGGQIPSMATIDSTMSRFAMSSGTVVAELLELNEPPPRDTLNRPFPCADAIAGAAQVTCAATQRLDQLVAFSPWSALLRKIRWTITPGARLYRLANGDSMILRQDLLASPSAPRSTERTVANLRVVAEELQARHLRLVTVLVPSKETVYGPLTEQPVRSAAESDEYLARLEQDVRVAGIEVVNVAPMLRAFATAHLAERQYAYFLDDTHWNVCGIAVAARAVAAVLTAHPSDSAMPTSLACPTLR